MKRLTGKFFATACLSVLCAIGPLQVLAQENPATNLDIDPGFNPSAILDDSDIFDLGSMNLQQIQNFLAAKGTLGFVKLKDIDGKDKSPAEIIWRVATSYKINPKYLLALIQKEQSLVEDPTPVAKQFDWAAGYAVCDSCSMNDPSLLQFKGFASQIEWAAKQHREKYLLQILGRGTTIAGYAPGKTIKIDGQTVTPQNQATAMLYSYTPHLHGNLNLWNIWRRWFALSFPDGTIVRGKTSRITYLIRFNEKRPFANRAVAYSMADPKKIVDTDDSQLTAYPTGATISFPNYSLVETPDHKRYLLAGDNKRLIENNKVFYKFGFNEDEVVEADAADLSAYGDGPDITMATAYPTGLLAKDASGNYWYVENGARHLIPHASLLTLYFKDQPAKLLTAKKLSALTIGSPYQIHDGELVRSKTDPAVFVIENGIRRPIPSADTFTELGWKWTNVVMLPAKILKDYVIGQPVLAHALIPTSASALADKPAPTSTAAVTSVPVAATSTPAVSNTSTNL